MDLDLPVIAKISSGHPSCKSTKDRNFFTPALLLFTLFLSACGGPRATHISPRENRSAVRDIHMASYTLNRVENDIGAAAQARDLLKHTRNACVRRGSDLICQVNSVVAYNNVKGKPRKSTFSAVAIYGDNSHCRTNFILSRPDSPIADIMTYSIYITIRDQERIFSITQNEAITIMNTKNRFLEICDGVMERYNN
jgi:hypothetical protein